MFYAEMIMVSLNAWDFLIYFKVLTVKKEQKNPTKLSDQTSLATWYK